MYLPILLLNNIVPTPRSSKDVYDRTWVPFFMKEWTQISTDLGVKNDNKYVPPEDALKTAATPTNASEPLTIKWTNSDNPNAQYYVYRHFAEIQDLRANDIREFNMLWNGVAMSPDPEIPTKLKVNTIYSRSPRFCDEGKCIFQLIRTIDQLFHLYLMLLKSSQLSSLRSLKQMKLTVCFNLMHIR